MKKAIAWIAMAAMIAPCAQAQSTEYTTGLFPEDVLVLEERLAALGYMSSACDEVFDANTVLALESFQTANGLPVTGEADGPTLNLLNSADSVTKVSYLETFAQRYASARPIANGDNGMAVNSLQKKLKEYGYFTRECDGLFGDATQSALEKFQMANGLPSTGIADGATLMRLYEGTPISWNAYLEDRVSETGDSGLNVYALQKKLSQMGYFQGDCSGSFGDVTRQAVVQLQSANGLEPSGVADTAVWKLIYSGSAIAPKRADALQLGDSGENVQKLQQRLKDLGYFSHEITGSFTLSTETAVRLFQMANGLTVDGEVGEASLSALNDPNVRAISDPAVQDMFQAMLDTWDPDAFKTMAQIAGAFPGSAFSEADEDLYPGFSFVQYVAVAAGLPVTGPEILMRLTDQQVQPGEKVPEGNIVAFQTARDDRITILLTISLGEGRVVYATAEGSFVVVSYMDQMDCSNMYRWGEKVEPAQ